MAPAWPLTLIRADTQNVAHTSTVEFEQQATMLWERDQLAALS